MQNTMTRRDGFNITPKKVVRQRGSSSCLWYTIESLILINKITEEISQENSLQIRLH